MGYDPKDTKCTVTKPLVSKIQMIHDIWHVLKIRQYDYFAVQAFYDDRPLLGDTPVLRLIVVSSIEAHEKLVNLTLFCYAWVDNEKHVLDKNDNGGLFISNVQVDSYKQKPRKAVNGTK